MTHIPGKEICEVCGHDILGPGDCAHIGCREDLRKTERLEEELRDQCDKVTNEFTDMAIIHTVLTDIYEHTAGSCECGGVMSKKEFNERVSLLIFETRKKAVRDILKEIPLNIPNRNGLLYSIRKRYGLEDWEVGGR